MPYASDCICPAALAVPHLLHIFCTFVLHFSLHLRGGGSDIGKFILGDQRDDIEGIDSHFPYLFSNLWNMLLVDTWDIDRIDLDNHVALDCHLDPFQLVPEKDFCSFKTGVPLPIIINKLVDLCPYLGIDCIQCDSDISHIVFLKEINFIGQQEAVGTDALDNIRKFLVKPAEGRFTSKVHHA